MSRINRLGNRFAADITLPPMPQAVGRVYVARLIQGKTAGVIIPYPQPELTIGSPGSPVVDVAGQLGSTLNVRGGTAGYQIVEGQFFSIWTDGRRYLHQATADTTLNGSGAAAVPITPMLRRSPVDAAPVEIAAPMIEGLLQSSGLSWTVDLAAIFGLQFTIAESA